MPTNANLVSANLANVPDAAKSREARDKAVALEFVRRGEGPIAPCLAREMGKDPKFIYRALRNWLDWARAQINGAELPQPLDRTASRESLPDSSVTQGKSE